MGGGWVAASFGGAFLAALPSYAGQWQCFPPIALAAGSACRLSAVLVRRLKARSGCTSSRRSSRSAWSSSRGPCAQGTGSRRRWRWCPESSPILFPGSFAAASMNRTWASRSNRAAQTGAADSLHGPAIFRVGGGAAETHGRNLAELLDKLAQLIRERFKLRARIRAVSAQGLMSGRILASIPIGVCLLMFVVNPQYARFFVDDPAGHELMAAGLGLQFVGYLIIRKIVTIEV